MTSTRAPLPPVRAAVELAVRSLPELDDRLRYRSEFIADLTTLSPVDQLKYATGILSQTFALRAALGSTPSRAEEDAMTLTTARPPFWRCRVFRAHRWVTRSTEDGGRYRTCSGCGREQSGSPTYFGGIGAGW